MLLVCATSGVQRTHKIVYLMHDKGKYIISLCFFSTSLSFYCAAQTEFKVKEVPFNFMFM